MPRMYRRLQISLPAIVTINSNERCERNFILVTVDISASGAMFCSEQTFPPNTHVKVVFLLKQGHSPKLKIMFTGRVTRLETDRFAVAFDDVDPMIVQQVEATFKNVSQKGK